MGVVDRLVLLVIALAVRIPLILAWPAVHGGDSIHRVACSDSVVLAYQLPLPQLLVFVMRAIDPDPVWVRLAFALVGALASVALAAVVAGTAGDSAGRAAGGLLALHPLLVYYSIVPYQESLTLLLLLLGAFALLRGHDRLATLAIGAACLCRYEAWIAAGLAAFARRHEPLRAIALFGWAPLLWVGLWHGLSPAGTYVLDVDPAVVRVSRLTFLLGKVQEYSGPGLLVLALAGALLAWRRRPPGWGWAAAFVTLMLVAVVGAGHEFPPGSGRVSERLGHIPAAALCALAGLALGALSRAAFGQALAAFLLATLGLGWVRRSETLVIEANADPSLRLAVDVARVASEELTSQGRLAVAGPPVEAAAIEDYVRKVEQAGGDVARARAIGHELAHHSPDLERVAAHLPRSPGAVIPPGTGATEMIAVYDDTPERERWVEGALAARFEAGGRGVTVYRRGPPLPAR